MSKPLHYQGDQPGLEVGMPPPQPDYAGYQHQQSPYYQAASKEGADAPQLTQLPPPRICGLPTRTFWMVFALALLVIGAALGGGLGGGLSAAHKTAHVPADSGSSSITPDQQQTTSHSASPAATTTGPSTISLSASTSAPSSTIQPFSTSPGTYRIINVYTNTAVDLLNGGTTNDTEIECWEWDPHATPSSYVHQAWLMSSVGNNAVTLYNTASSSYLTAPSGLTFGADPSDNTLAQTYGAVPGNPGDTHTQFTIVKNSDNSISFQSVYYQTKLLDLSGGGATDGTPIIVWEANGGANQRWTLVPS